MRLATEDVKLLFDEASQAFSSDDLDIIVPTRFGLPYGHIASDRLTDINRIIRLIQYFQMRNEAEKLVAVFREARPSVPGFAELAERVGMMVMPDHSALQVLVRPTSGATVGVDPAQFRADLARREDTICRIVVGGNRFGTGMLVGETLVLTNFHVVESGFDGANLTRQIACQFDYRETAGAGATPMTDVKAKTVRAFSRYDPQDLIAGPATDSTANLDYALLEIDKPLASRPIVLGGEPRGYTEIAAAPPIAAETQAVLLLQHPNAQPMRLDLGSVTWTGAARLRHSANTLGGSSGAPVFDADLALVGLHHAGYDWPSLPKPANQAIPMALVAADARQQGAAI
jgi:V8-like Glu-specific endopeptidase